MNGLKIAWVTPNLRFDTDRQQQRCAPLLAAGQAARWASQSTITEEEALAK